MFQWRKKRAPEKAQRCDLCDRVSIHRDAVSRGETIYERGAGFTEKRRGRWVRRA